METIGERLSALRQLGAGDQQCHDCLDSQFPGMESMKTCKKCIADTPAFSLLIASLIKPIANA